MFDSNVQGFRTDISGDSKVFFQQIGERNAIIFHNKCPVEGKITTLMYSPEEFNPGLLEVKRQFTHLIDKIKRNEEAYSVLSDGEKKLILRFNKGKSIVMCIETPSGTSAEVFFMQGPRDVMARKLNYFARMMLNYLSLGDLGFSEEWFKIYHEQHLYYIERKYKLDVNMGQQEDGFCVHFTMNDQCLELWSKIESLGALKEHIRKRTQLLAAISHLEFTTSNVHAWNIDGIVVNKFVSPHNTRYITIANTTPALPSNTITIPMTPDGAIEMFFKAIHAEIEVLISRFPDFSRNDSAEVVTLFKRVYNFFLTRGKLNDELRTMVVTHCDGVRTSINEMISAFEAFRINYNDKLRGRTHKVLK